MSKPLPRSGWQRSAARFNRLLCFAIDRTRLAASARYAHWRPSRLPVGGPDGLPPPESDSAAPLQPSPIECFTNDDEMLRVGVESGAAVGGDLFGAAGRSGRSFAHGATFQHGQRVLVMDVHVPRADRDSGSLRMHNMLRLLRELGCHVIFWPAYLGGYDDYARALEQDGIELVHTRWPAQALRWWYEHGDELDVVLLSRLPVALPNVRLARRYASQALLVFDTVDLHFLRAARAATLHEDSEKALLAEEMRRDELGLMRKADLTLVVSEFERNLLRELVPSADVRVLSNIHSVHGSKASFAERTGLLFLGNFEHLPNLDAAQWLVTEIMPRLRASSLATTLHIVGNAADRAMAGCADENVEVHGFVQDLELILGQVKLAVAPLRYGAGVKGKINMAMSHGVPVVTTSIGAEGMGLVDRRDALIADDPDAFTQAIVDLFADELLWCNLSEHGLDNVRQRFSPALARGVLQDILVRSVAPAVNHLPARR